MRGRAKKNNTKKKGADGGNTKALLIKIARPERRGRPFEGKRGRGRPKKMVRRSWTGATKEEKNRQEKEEQPGEAALRGKKKFTAE